MNQIFFNINDSHFKVWGCDLFSDDTNNIYEVVTYYGRIGVPMQNLRKHKKVFNKYYKAYDYIWDKIREKTNQHGYNSMPNSQYFDAIVQEKPISQLINLMEIYKKEQS